MKNTLVKINERDYTATSSNLFEDMTTLNHNVIFDLNYLGSLDLSGDGAANFLQGQLTGDIRNVNPQNIQQSALCNLKGRIEALMDVVEWQGLHLILPNDLISEVNKSLSKAALFSKVTLSANNSFRIFGFKLNNPALNLPFNAPLPNKFHGVIHTEDYCCYHLQDDLYIFLVKNANIDKFLQCPHNFYGSLAWHNLQLKAENVEIYPNSRGLFLPHQLGLQNKGYLSFNKGCYKGQEIIARMHYLAKLKHELCFITMPNNFDLIAGQDLLNPDTHEKIGEIVDSCPLNSSDQCIAILRTHTV